MWISHGDQFEYFICIPFNRNCKSYIYFNLVPDGRRYHNKSSASANPALRVAYFPQIEIPSKYRSSGWNNFKVCFVGLFKCGKKVAFKVESYGIHLIYDDAQDNHQQGLYKFNVKRGHDETED